MDLFKFMPDLFNEVTNGWLKNITQIENQVLSPVNKMVDTVVGGIWKGAGADKFVMEMKNVVIPMLGSLLTLQTNWTSALKKVADTLMGAVTQSTNQVGELVDFFNSMF